jgi:hypothetical protein
MEIITGTAPHVEVAERVRVRAGGNPLFVTELARLAGERGLTNDSTVPDAIRDIVRDRLAGLPERAIAELEVTAVLGERFDVRVAMAASEREPDDCIDALDAAIVTRILVPESGGFRFAHALVRDAILADISALRLARLHQRAAEAILAVHGDGPDHAEPVAHHRLAAAAISDPVETARAAVRAADVARWRGSLDAADQLVDRALGLLADVPRTPEVTSAQVDAMGSMISVLYRRPYPFPTESVTDRLEALAKRTDSDSARALWLFLTWGDVDQVPDLRPLRTTVDTARALADQTSEPYAELVSRYIVAGYSLLTGRLDDASEQAERAVLAAGTARPHERPDQVKLVSLPAVAGLIAALRGDRDRSEAHTRRTETWLSPWLEIDVRARASLDFSRALAHAILDDPVSVIEDLRDTAGCSTIGFVGHDEASSDLLTGWALTKLGDRTGPGRATGALDLIRAGPDTVLLPALQTFVADALLTIGDAQAVKVLDQARRNAHERDELWWLAETMRLQAIADVAFQDGTRAGDLLDEAEALAHEQGVRVLLPRIATSRDAFATRAPPSTH